MVTSVQLWWLRITPGARKRHWDWLKGKGMNKLLINVKQLSESTGLSVFTLYSWINQKRIPYVKVGRLVRFDPKKIEKWIDEKTVEEKNW